jgi:hypothetical protein
MTIDSRYIDVPPVRYEDRTERGFTVRVTIVPDEVYEGPSDFTTRHQSPALFEAWERGTLSYVGMVVTPLYPGTHDAIESANASLWSIHYGSFEDGGAMIHIGTDRVIADNFDDLVAQVRANLREIAELASPSA